MCGPMTLKPHLSEPGQLGKLLSRGLSIDDELGAIRDLARFGYYRLSGYYYPLRKCNPEGQVGRRDEFVEGASFSLIVALADFDKRLRLLALDGIEAVEVAVRVAIAHRMGKLSALAHLDPGLLDRKFTRPHAGHADSLDDAWRERFAELCSKSKEDFWLHHVERYGGQMPIWAAIELWDFGLLSRFYEGMQQRDRDAVDLPDLAKLPPLETCRLLQPLHESEFARRRIFGAFTCLRLLLRSIHPISDWPARVKALILSFPRTPLISIESAGFRPGWHDSEIWR